MTVAKIIEYDPDEGTYHIPSEHAAWLGKQAANNDFAPIFELIPTLGSAEDGIVSSFRNGGGLTYDDYHRFHHVLAIGNRASQDVNFIERDLPLVPGIIPRLETGLDVADLCCGQGHTWNLMAAAYPNSRFIGIDFVAEIITSATDEAKQMGLENVRYAQQAVTNLDMHEAFDFIMAIDAIHDQTRPEQVLANIHNALRPDGIFLTVDIKASSHLEKNIDHPLGPFLYTVSVFQCLSISLGQGGPGLGAVWGRELASQMLEAADFADLVAKKAPGNLTLDYYICYKR